MAKSSSEDTRVYLFFENNDRPRKYVYSFFKIDVKLGNSKLSIEESPNQPPNSKLSIEESPNQPLEMKTAPIFQFPAGEYPNEMGCIPLDKGGSMFYFCGGFFPFTISLLKQPNPALKPMELLNQVFPPYIYTLDAAAASDAKVLKLGGQLETGKSNPIVFAAKGKIYVLSAYGNVKRQLLGWFRNHKGCYLEGHRNGGGEELLSRSVMLFECYDPVEDKSEVLPDLPLRKFSYLSGYLLLEDQHKMVLSARGFDDFTHLLYDFNQKTWLCQLNQNTYPSSSFLHCVNNLACYFVEGFCYGLGFQTLMSCPIPRKLGPFRLKMGEQEEDGKPNVCAMSLVNPEDTILLAGNFDCTNMLHHLGDTSFLFVSSAQTGLSDFMEMEDPYAHNVSITIFKDVDGDAYAKLSSFKSEIIFSQHYVLKTDYDCLRKLRACFHA